MMGSFSLLLQIVLLVLDDGIFLSTLTDCTTKLSRIRLRNNKGNYV